MRLKAYHAATAAEALRRVAAELGHRALVVETRQAGNGVEVVVALPGERAAAAGGLAAAPVPAGLPRALRGAGQVLDRLAAAGLSPEVRQVVTEALAGCGVVLDRPGDPAVPVVAARILGGLLSWQALPDDRRRAVALVGPTGVGKTTTLAKLASRAVVDEGLQVALITLDTYRLGAVEQLRAYADLLGVPLGVVFTPQDLREALVRHGRADRIFLDTPGRGPLDLRAVRELRGFLEQAGVTPLLVLPAGARLQDLRAAGRTFGLLKPAGLLLTKWDETAAPGEAVSYAIESRLPLTWIADGQEVPADLHPARPEAVARGLLAGPAARVGARS